MAVHGGELAAAMTFKHPSREGEGHHLGGVRILEGLEELGSLKKGRRRKCGRDGRGEKRRRQMQGDWGRFISSRCP